ncbi:MAG: SIMPL domain-containing protein [Bacteroidetes bacterium]|nr:SIMPL domain-containing protein [Bacteroidota bacterium]
MRRLVFLLVTFAVVSMSWAQSEITVSSNADVSAKPDIAEFHLSIIARQEQATNAFKIYLNRYHALQNSIKNLVDTTKLTTDNLSVTPFFDYKKPDQVTPEYYQVSTSMSLSVPIYQLNDVLGEVTSVEGVTINGIEFRAKDQDKLETEALEKAVILAREKAEAIAHLEGLVDLTVKSMTTSTSRPPIFPTYRAMSVESVAAAPSISPSSISVSAFVNVTYRAHSK